MLNLNVNEEKQLTFEIKINGVSTDSVSSFLRIEIGNVEYGFPAVIQNESIIVDLPALKTITNKRLKEGEEANVRLDVIADGTYLTPWKDTFTLSNPLVVEAKIVGSQFKIGNEIKPKIISNERVIEDTKQKFVNEEEMTERIVSKISEKFSSLFENSDSRKIIKETKPIKGSPVKESKVLSSKNVKSKVTPNSVKNITKEGVYEYMKRAGTKSEHIQEILYEQAERAAGTSKPVEVLKQIVKIMKRKE